MAEFVKDCSICSAKHMTFDVIGDNELGPSRAAIVWEVVGVCRACRRVSTFLAYTLPAYSHRPRDDLTPALQSNLIRVGDSVIHRRRDLKQAPPNTPDSVALAFNEGTVCLAEKCWTAAGVMFRKSLDLATESFLPPHPTVGLKVGTRRLLGQRLNWLFDNQRLPADLRNLAAAILEDGNDGAHGPPLTQVVAEDLLDFADALLRRLFTEPAKIKEAEQRRLARRDGA